MSLWKKWAGVAALASVASAAVLIGSLAGAGVVGSKHDLSTSGPGAKFTFANGSTEICVFCHTPHGSDTSTGVPLWNRVATAATYTPYSSSSFSGTVTMTGAPSLVCLSCHDGTVAMNNMINAPGSGGYTSTGALASGTWTGSGTITGAANIDLIGTDLRNDHPVAAPYAGGVTGAVAPSGVSWTSPTFRDNQFRTVSGDGAGNWWVDTIAVGTAGTRDKTDMWLYARTDPRNSLVTPFVECASCHTPHDNTYAPFMRTSNAGSNICLTCHVK